MDQLFKIYSLGDKTYKWYREDTKRGKNCTRDCVERKLTALMLCAVKVSDNGCGCKTYRFGTFNIAVREKADDIGVVYWTQRAIYVSPEKSQQLHECYKYLGLSEDGQSVISDIDYVGLNEFCKKNDLSNTRPYRNEFLVDLSKAD